MLQELVDDFYDADGYPVDFKDYETHFMETSKIYDEDTEGKLDLDNEGVYGSTATAAQLATDYTVRGMYLNREPRFYQSVTFTGMPWASSGKEVDFSYGGSSGAGSGDGEPNTGHMVYKRYYKQLGDGSRIRILSASWGAPVSCLVRYQMKQGNGPWTTGTTTLNNALTESMARNQLRARYPKAEIRILSFTRKR